MLDTVILQLNQGQYSIVQADRFMPPLTEHLLSGSGFAKAINNPTKAEKEANYYPRITWLRRGNRKFLKIECSVAKLVFNDNLNEVSETDFSIVIRELRNRMQEMGVMVFSKFIENAEVLSFHPSKNIQLTGGYTATYAINELSKVNLTKHLDLNKADFRNSGHSTQFYAVSNSFVLYDKIADMRKPKSRAIDKDQTPEQLNILDVIQEQRLQMEVLRLETRLNGKQKMNHILRKLKISESPTFKQVFNKTLCQKVLQHYWDTYISEPNKFLFDLDSSPQKLLQKVLISNPSVTPRKAIFLVGLNLLSRDQDGIRGVRNIIESYGSKHSWASIRRDLQVFDNQAFTGQIHGFVRQIERDLQRFESFRFDKTS